MLKITENVCFYMVAFPKKSKLERFSTGFRWMEIFTHSNARERRIRSNNNNFDN